jgi:hypothetical protein
MELSGYGRANHPEREKYMIQVKKKWSQLLGICMAFMLLMPFQKEKF